jgi:VCBS repeat-containing protein
MEYCPMVSAPKLAFFVSDDAIAFAPLAPAPSAAPIARRRKWNPSAASNSFAMMLPLSMLAACGGGGGVAPSPPAGPPAAGGTITVVADVNSATAGAAAVTVAAPGVLSNDMATGGTPIVSSGQGVGAAVAVTSTTAGVITGTYGTLTLNQTGGYSYNPNLATSLGAGVARTDVFNYAAAVSGGSATGTSTLTITVTGVNDAPTAVADTATASVGARTATTAATGVLANDSDPDTVGTTSTLTVTGVAAGTTVGTVGVGSTIAGAFGTLTLAADGSYSYQASATAPAGSTDTFTYRVADNAATPLSSTATLTFSFGTPPATIGALLDITNQTTGTNVVRITGPLGVNAELGAAVAGSTTAVTSGGALLIGAPGIGSDAGGAYLISGLSSGAASVVATSGTLINGLAAGARLGTSVDLGNVGGDASADILIGAPGVVQTGVANGGAAYTIYGGAGLVTNLGTALNGTNGFTINGSNGGGAYSRPTTSVAAEGDNTGFLVRFLGDINGDTRADILVGSPGVDFGGAAARDAGAATFVYGTAAAQPASSIYTDFASTTAVRGFVGNTSNATADENTPTAAASGNLNNAGSADFVYTSAFYNITLSAVARIDAGVAFVGFSTLNPQGGIFDGATFNGTNGYRIIGAAGGDRLGFSVAVGDVNGDGIGDIVLGAPGVDGAGTDRGAVYIVYGSATAPATANLDLASLTGSTGTINGLSVARIDGPTTNGAGFGSSVAVGDFNGDGRADIAVGADGTGDVFLIYGRGTAANQASVNVNTPTAGVVTLLDGLSTTGQTNFHISLAANFDLNGDGRSELLIGATGDNADGAAYLVFGATTSSAVPNALEGILAPEATAAQVALDNLLGGGSAVTSITGGDTVFTSLPLPSYLELHVNLA